MDIKTPWTQLRYGSVEAGLHAIEKTCSGQDAPSSTMELGVAYLWLKQYDTALNHFKRTIARYPRSISSFYCMAGVASWCLNQPGCAVDFWVEGLRVRYADSGVAIHLPLLLFLASSLAEGQYSRLECRENLVRAMREPRASSWPGPVAAFVIGEIDFDSAMQAACDTRIGQLSPSRKWLLEFYRGVVNIRRGCDPSNLRDTLSRLVDTSGGEWCNEKDFLHLLWTAEFHIARYEAERAAPRTAHV